MVRPNLTIIVCIKRELYTYSIHHGIENSVVIYTNINLSGLRSYFMFYIILRRYYIVMVFNVKKYFLLTLLLDCFLRKSKNECGSSVKNYLRKILKQ